MTQTRVCDGRHPVQDRLPAVRHGVGHARLPVGRAVQGAGGGVLLALAYAVARIAFAESLWPRVRTFIAIVWARLRCLVTR